MIEAGRPREVTQLATLPELSPWNQPDDLLGPRRADCTETESPPYDSCEPRQADRPLELDDVQDLLLDHGGGRAIGQRVEHVLRSDHIGVSRDELDHRTGADDGRMASSGQRPCGPGSPQDRGILQRIARRRARRRVYRRQISEAGGSATGGREHGRGS